MKLTQEQILQLARQAISLLNLARQQRDSK